MAQVTLRKIVKRFDEVEAVAGIDLDLAVGDLLEPGDHPQRGGLAAARRSDQHDELLVGDVEVDAAHRLGVVEAFHHLAQRDLGHD